MAKKEKKATNNENSKENKNKKSFFKGLKAELKKVIWPTPKQLVNNTVAVVTIVLITALIVFVLDLAFESLNKYGVDKIKQSIQSLESTTDDNNTTDSNETTSNETVDNNSTDDNNTTEAEETLTNETTNETQNSSENNVE